MREWAGGTFRPPTQQPLYLTMHTIPYNATIPYNTTPYHIYHTCRSHHIIQGIPYIVPCIVWFGPLQPQYTLHIVLKIHGSVHCVVNKPQAPPAVPMHATPQGHLRTHTTTMQEGGCFRSRLVVGYANPAYWYWYDSRHVVWYANLGLQTLVLV